MKQKPFLWGVTNIGAQTEGRCTASNWALWERRGLVPTSGHANDYWQRFVEDHDLAQDLGVGGFRLTVEWSRIEPQEGAFDIAAIKHYRTILEDLQRRNIKTVVGLWHWSVPAWFENKYGMHHHSSPEHFLRFASRVRDGLGDVIDMVVVLNEPMVYIGTSYLQGTRPPFIRSLLKGERVLNNLILIHNQTYDVWKEKYPQTLVGSTHLWNDIRWRFRGIFGTLFNTLTAYFRVHYISRRTNTKSDFLGVNYYSSNRFFCGKSGGRWGIHGTNDWHDGDVWKSFPSGLHRVLNSASVYDKPLYILENGKPTNLGPDDYDRQEFLTASVHEMHKAVLDGAPVEGYFHYSLCDSYEWNSGYDFRFGLVEIDRKTLLRTKRRSFETYKKLIAQ